VIVMETREEMIDRMAKEKGLSKEKVVIIINTVSRVFKELSHKVAEIWRNLKPSLIHIAEMEREYQR
jgi:hypothetical protein